MLTTEPYCKVNLHD